MISSGVVIYNNKAGNAKKAQLLQEIEAVLQESVKELTFYQPESEEDLKEYLADDSRSFQYVWIMGGDGTVHASIDALRKRTITPVICILPAGTCNDFARSLGLPINPVEAARVSLQKKVKNIDIGVYNGSIFSNFLGIGVIADTSENINESAKDTVGRLSYFMSAIRTLGSADNFQYDVTIDGEKYNGEAVMILVSNGKFLGTTPLPAEDIDLQDGKLDVFFMKGTGGELFREWLQRTVTANTMEDTEGVRHIQGESIEINTNPVKKVDTDGEIKSETPVKISVLHQYLPFCCGIE
ncbi:diacylglycerol/lipid kinase family protein [Alkalicoccus daliensis]|uniref:Lipid kinase, YegS/Rv2252/BmrU family n=1 Tax=Alkalicoccus daliensis TaxID=745820 RepID=A0A1H0DXH2_9BACI|nr:diacylglycerol kinase family protein [Alkalicoccus daliensis]SDN74799.1 lipid kinase, YegS/Rv2252/BmrU family [Alkalicoccus daliensis]